MADLTYGRVTGRFLAFMADTRGDIDLFPDEVPLTGTVTFTASIPGVMLERTGQASALAVARPITATLDREGYLSLNGDRGVFLIATDTAAFNPTGFTYQVSFSGLRQDGSTVVFPAFSFKLPAGSTVDLAEVAPIPSAPGTITVRDEAAARAAEAAAKASATAAASSASTAAARATAAATSASSAATTLTAVRKAGDEEEASIVTLADGQRALVAKAGTDQSNVVRAAAAEQVAAAKAQADRAQAVIDGVAGNRFPGVFHRWAGPRNASVSERYEGTSVRRNLILDPNTTDLRQWRPTGCTGSIVNGKLRLTPRGDQTAYVYPATIAGQNDNGGGRVAVTLGDRATFTVDITNPGTDVVYVRVAFVWYTATGANSGANGVYNDIVALAPGATTTQTVTAVVSGGVGTNSTLPLVYVYGTQTGGFAPATAIIDVTSFQFESSPATSSARLSRFSGDSRNSAPSNAYAPAAFHRWLSTPNLSQSERYEGSTKKTNRAINTLNGTSLSGVGGVRGTLSLGLDFVRMTVNDALAGGFSQRFVVGAANASVFAVDVTPGETIPVSVDVRSSTRQPMGLYLVWFKADGTSPSAATIALSTPTDSSNWTRIEGEAAVPADIVRVMFWIGYGNGATVAVGDTFDARNLLYGAYGPFFDGSSPNTAPESAFIQPTVAVDQVARAAAAAAYQLSDFPNGAVLVRTAGGAKGQIPFSYGASGDTIPVRNPGGTLSMGTPTDAAHGAPRKYVDDAITSARAYADTKAIQERFAPGTTGTRQWQKLATVRGNSASGGGHAAMLLSGTGNISTGRRGTILIHAGQRGSNGVDLRAWGWDVENTDVPVELYTRLIGEFDFEVWGYFANYNNTIGLTALSLHGAVLNTATDAPTPTKPSGMSAKYVIATTSAGAYVLPAGGIPSSDLSQNVQDAITTATQRATTADTRVAELSALRPIDGVLAADTQVVSTTLPIRVPTLDVVIPGAGTYIAEWEVFYSAPTIGDIVFYLNALDRSTSQTTGRLAIDGYGSTATASGAQSRFVKKLIAGGQVAHGLGGAGATDAYAISTRIRATFVATAADRLTFLFAQLQPDADPSAVHAMSRVSVRKVAS